MQLAWKAAAAMVLVCACVVNCRDSAAFDLDDPTINALSDADTSDDMQAFDNSYDDTLVNKVVDDQSFDPDQLFSKWEKLGEARARKNLQTDVPSPKPLSVHRKDVMTAENELQNAADLAESIAEHPSQFHSLVAHAPHQEMLGESDVDAPADKQSSGVVKKVAAPEIRAEAEAKLKAADAAVAAYGVLRAEHDAHEHQMAHITTKSHKTGSDVPISNTGMDAQQTIHMLAKQEKEAALAKAKENQSANAKEANAKEANTTGAKEANAKDTSPAKPDTPAKDSGSSTDSAAKSSDPVGGKASPDTHDKKQAGDAKSSKGTPAPKDDKDKAHEAEGKAANDPVAGSSSLPNSDKTRSTKTNSSKPSAADGAAPREGNKKAEVPPADKASETAPAKSKEEETPASSAKATQAEKEAPANAKQADATAPAKAKDTKETTPSKTDKAPSANPKGTGESAPAKAKGDAPAKAKGDAPAKAGDAPAKDAKEAEPAKAKGTDYFMEAAKAMKSGMSAAKLLAVAKQAYKKGNKEKAKAFLAAAEEVEAKQAKEEDKPKEHLLDILRRKQGHAVKMNPAALAAQRAIVAMGKKIPVTANTFELLNAPHKSNIHMADEVSVAEPKPKLEPTAAAADSDEQEAHDAETALIATQKAAQIAIAKAKARVAVIRARQKAKKQGHSNSKPVSHGKNHVDIVKGHVQKEAMKLQKGALKKAPGPGGGKDSFGFSTHSHKNASPAPAPPPEEKSASPPPPPGKDTPAPNKPKEKEEEKKSKQAVPKEETFGFGKGKQSDPKTAKASNMKALERQAATKQAIAAAAKLHVWVKSAHEVSKDKGPAIKKKIAHHVKKLSSEKKTQSMSPKKELSEKSKASKIADDMHIWVNGQPKITKRAKKEDKAVVKTTVAPPKDPTSDDLGESQEMEAEGIETMREMKLVAKHIEDSSKSLSKQNEIPSQTEYNFSIRNTDKHDRSMGHAKNVHLDVNFPKEAKLTDAYFYLEAEGKDEPESRNCKILPSDGSENPQVSCFVPKVKDIVDVYVRAHYDGDQKALSQLTSGVVDATLHEGHEVLTTTKLNALQRRRLLKRMPQE